MKEYRFIAETPSAKIVVCLNYIKVSAKSLIPYENNNSLKIRCEQGCQNYNNKWSCPPHSPKYSVISKKFNNAYVFLFYCHLEQFSYIKTPYMKIRVANSILKSRSDKIIRQLEKESNGKMLANNSCRLCKECSCKTKESKCKKPSKLRFSMESVGLNVESIAMDFFDHKLLSYSKDNVPLYSSVVTTILTNEIIEEDKINELFLNMGIEFYLA
ncbi:Predicted metal-binding protein [Clostridium cavendishii DSM 21758]|uniref:Predicted metal-binding protein n=1 Tax=Clostridium cavendishii DSM 21758 TaxID=1121302 RepID=A0A1M6N7K1_9CLOT|nr:DUF2284 domain-containing protein [Clostridium cavendishii]SHJ91679.1 Predicted metal-binding protein [Clostridium cavendishii DSM 21758]